MPWKKSEPMEERTEFGLNALEGGNFRALCREYGITARTGYKWRERLLRWGTEGLREESRRPQRSPGALGEREVCEMVGLKQTHLRWGRARSGNCICDFMVERRARAVSSGCWSERA
jgi:transposase-like protein